MKNEEVKIWRLASGRERGMEQAGAAAQLGPKIKADLGARAKVLAQALLDHCLDLRYSQLRHVHLRSAPYSIVKGVGGQGGTASASIRMRVGLINGVEPDGLEPSTSVGLTNTGWLYQGLVWFYIVQLNNHYYIWVSPRLKVSCTDSLQRNATIYVAYPWGSPRRSRNRSRSDPRSRSHRRWHRRMQR